MFRTIRDFGRRVARQGSTHEVYQSIRNPLRSTEDRKQCPTTGMCKPSALVARACRFRHRAWRFKLSQSDRHNPGHATGSNGCNRGIGPHGNNHLARIDETTCWTIAGNADFVQCRTVDWNQSIHNRQCGLLKQCVETMRGVFPTLRCSVPGFRWRQSLRIPSPNPEIMTRESSKPCTSAASLGAFRGAVAGCH